MSCEQNHIITISRDHNVKFKITCQVQEYRYHIHVTVVSGVNITIMYYITEENSTKNHTGYDESAYV